MRKKFHSFICPVDGIPLCLNGNNLFCASGHCFDIAKQGYVNLLLAQHKKSSAPGDSKAMVEARRRFLQSGVYEPVLKQLFTIVEDCNLAKQSTILDAGCGEGYYTRRLAIEFPQHQCIGLDISKDALKLASKKDDAIDWVVASNSQLPIAPASVDLIICIFGFHSFAGFSKVLKPQGKIILVDPAEGHLLDLRKHLYERVRMRAAYSIEDAKQYGLSLINEQRFSFIIHELMSKQILDLLAMTPHLFRAPKQGKIKVEGLECLDLNVDLLFRTLML